jgi:hypothetical protein
MLNGWFDGEMGQGMERKVGGCAAATADDDDNDEMMK